MTASWAAWVGISTRWMTSPVTRQMTSLILLHMLATNASPAPIAAKPRPPLRAGLSERLKPKIITTGRPFWCVPEFDTGRPAGVQPPTNPTPCGGRYSGIPPAYNQPVPT